MIIGAVTAQPSMQAFQIMQNLDAQNTQALQNSPHSNNIFGMLMDSIASTTTAAAAHDNFAQNTTIDFVLGRHDDMLAVILAQEQAHASMSFTVQVISRMVGAYQEIMRMQM
jgi:flagellar hook-basal body complex protein FliE